MERRTEGPVPVPVRLIVCGLPARLSAMVTAAVRSPMAVGENFTRIVQLPPPPNEVKQLLVSEKSPTLAPVTVMLLMVKLALPVLVMVTAWAELVVPTFWLVKVRVPLEKLTPPLFPEPCKATDCGLPAALSVIVRAVVRGPAALGLKVTLIVQLKFAFTTPPQVLV